VSSWRRRRCRCSRSFRGSSHSRRFVRGHFSLGERAFQGIGSKSEALLLIELAVVLLVVVFDPLAFQSGTFRRRGEVARLDRRPISSELVFIEHTIVVGVELLADRFAILVNGFELFADASIPGR